MIEKMIFVSDGVIALVAEGEEVPVQIDEGDIVFALKEYGAEISIGEISLKLPIAVLSHLEKAEDTFLYFYSSDPFSIIADYKGSIVLQRDDILKLKGAWEYSKPP
ncbi:hypothetical protein [Geobacter sp. DSM 9736]|uniref:hypothetical protein n=1 Tax=Geobacter sp. DSM 9736 TaxID=1277350 RepID=UPI000B508CD4|nr:hypothetical protein [Geobacter sp. DSM 9736]SNB45440.1 hypothetical protein SAMN06269301_0853 [Geobacter sp. DSM 9736]